MTVARGGRAVEPAGRGATRIADRVVAKIASQAAREALADDGGGGPDRTAPHASVTVHEETARVDVSVELGYPADIAGRCRAVRRRITERVRALAGMEVPEVVVTVERLHSPHLRGGGAERVR
ncbi:Asp23/Gls24 family envelope stress response protein [Streptomyces sp. AV19]|uniref:Asp23/Gls24 family envelope stress response protein n=1 Tax=Streptomyces sp. AV19 TaxID=2793068 RepID=UPI0018FE7326|nr:Asp23/Gls24 family envelope stress response protein [Streptomyces sp. AV19]MBH1936445.1 Asp23/Gls24 family envelope stress response protein [Streptomyces sp. AV19]MDG4532499.1 Asp23/Gls24 family envelope stress response protein [Streptomyces sp. AV19]